MLLSAIILVSAISCTLAVNFGWEKIQLTEAEARNYSAIRFGGSGPEPPERECRYIPGDKDWPSDADWTKFNETLGGALLKPLPLAAVCYSGLQYNPANCASLQRSWTDMDIHANNPISVMSQWSSGSSCVPTSNPNSTCIQGGYPVYVVNATTVRHIQLAVNFARNQNIRLVVKNSGHDFNGKSIGGNSLSIWVHNLKGFNYHENYNATGYSGRAVAYGGGFQAKDSYDYQSKLNFTMLVAGGATVGIAGGFLQGAGHSTFTSYYGMATDHVLSIQAVTADGKYVTADAKQNKDLFWAFRGGGGGTYGVITSVIVKAFPKTPTTSGSITFTTVPPGDNRTRISTETFWNGYNFIRHSPYGNSTTNSTGLTFTVSVSFPNKTTSEHRRIMRPMLEKLNALGIPVPLPPAMAVRRSYDIQNTDKLRHLATRDLSNPDLPDTHLHRRALGDKVGNTLIASRLWPRSSFTSTQRLEQMHLAIRDMVDVDKGGYTFHGMNYSPTLKVSGYPDNALNPPFRHTLLHAQAYEDDAHWDKVSPQKTIVEQKKRHDRLQSYMDMWKDLTPGSGSYMNEGDMQDTDWQASFYGRNYNRLLGVKRRWDPYSVFWAISAVGSDEWEVRGSSGGGREGVFTQDGQLCRT